MGWSLLLSSILDKFFPNQTEIKKADLELKAKEIDLAIQAKAIEYGLLSKQAETNTAEANNPNRKWVTWRELIGYACATALWYFWVIQPIISFILIATGHKLLLNDIPTLNITDILVVVGGMLGIPLTGYIYDKLGKTKK